MYKKNNPDAMVLSDSYIDLLQQSVSEGIMYVNTNDFTV